MSSLSAPSFELCSNCWRRAFALSLFSFTFDVSRIRPRTFVIYRVQYAYEKWNLTEFCVLLVELIFFSFIFQPNSKSNSNSMTTILNDRTLSVFTQRAIN